jgi:hypothetical protein
MPCSLFLANPFSGFLTAGTALLYLYSKEKGKWYVLASGCSCSVISYLVATGVWRLSPGGDPALVQARDRAAIRALLLIFGVRFISFLLFRGKGPAHSKGIDGLLEKTGNILGWYLLKARLM